MIKVLYVLIIITCFLLCLLLVVVRFLFTFLLLLVFLFSEFFSNTFELLFVSRISSASDSSLLAAFNVSFIFLFDPETSSGLLILFSGVAVISLLDRFVPRPKPYKI